MLFRITHNHKNHTGHEACLLSALLKAHSLVPQTQENFTIKKEKDNGKYNSIGRKGCAFIP